VVLAELTGNDNSSFRLTLTLDLEEDNYMTVGLQFIIAFLHCLLYMGRDLPLHWQAWRQVVSILGNE
jgi:hypothetical protein